MSEGERVAEQEAGEEVRVVDNPEEGRYELQLDDQLVGFSAYVLRPMRLIFTHTEIGGAHEGKGLGSKLAKGALDDVRRRGLRVTPRCPFIAAYIRRHPEYDDLVEDLRRQ